jgi:hypothetical protein
MATEVLYSDVVGAIAGVALAIPPLKDQWYRFRRASVLRRQDRAPWPGIRRAVAHAWELKRIEYDGKDSIALSVGSLGLVVSFAMKAFGY